MIETVQLAVSDPVYAAALREALTDGGPWQVIPVERPEFGRRGVLVLDEEALERVRLPLPDPERVVLITRRDPRHLSLAWEAGIVSVVSADDDFNTVLLAIMAAALRAPKPRMAAAAGELSPTPPHKPASIPPRHRPPAVKKHKIR